MTDAYEVYLLPKSHPDASIWSRLVDRQKSLRLQALQISPESFGSTYDREVKFTTEWDTRLRNPEAFTIVGSRQKVGEKINHDYVEKCLEGVWEGMVVLLGPFKKVIIVGTNDGNEEEEHGSEGDDSDLKTGLEFQIDGLFVMPDAQGLGLGKALILNAIEYAKRLGRKRSASELVVKLTVKFENTGALSLYKGLGFGITWEGAHHSSGVNFVVMELQCQVDSG